MQIAVCVKATTGASFDRERARAALGAAYSRIALELRWSRPLQWGQPPVIDMNCAVEPVLLKPGVVVSKGAINSIRIVPDDLLTPKEGRYLRYYFVLPKSEIDRLFFGDSYVPGHRNQVQEAQCPKTADGPSVMLPGTWPPEFARPGCTALSIGTYLTTDEIEDSRVMMPAVRYLHGVGR